MGGDTRLQEREFATLLPQPRVLSSQMCTTTSNPQNDRVVLEQDGSKTLDQMSTCWRRALAACLPMALATSQVVYPLIPTIGCSKHSVCHPSLKRPRVCLLLEAFPDYLGSLRVPFVNQPRPEAPSLISLLALPGYGRSFWALFSCPRREQDI